jgi:hypothetical protein
MTKKSWKNIFGNMLKMAPEHGIFAFFNIGFYGKLSKA